MAVVLRSNSDLVYLPDHGYVGDDGALRILLQVTRQIRRLDISNNLLGTRGTTTLFQGLANQRSRYATSPQYGEWGLREVNLGNNDIGDEALELVMRHEGLRRLWAQGNHITLTDRVESIVDLLNSSSIQDFSLTNNQNLLPSSVQTFFRTLDAPNLKQLYLSTCNIGADTGRSIVSFLTSPRSRNLELLELNGNCLGVQGVKRIVDAIESSNFTIKQLGLLANDSQPAVLEGEDPPFERSTEERRAEDRALSHHVHQRLPPLLERNRILTRRVRNAAYRIISPARIILNARPLSPEESAKRIISSVNLGSPPPFRLLDLPEEVIHLIIRHCSYDVTALSAGQFARVRADAEDRESSAKVRQRLMERKGRGYEAMLGAEGEVREEWLKEGRWDKWESDRPVLDHEEQDEPADGG